MATIGLYGAASDNIAQSYIDQVEALGKEMAKRGHRLIYGAGASGLMGAAARGVDAGNGHIIGVAPYYIHEVEPIYDCTEIIETQTLAERKLIIEQRSDALVVVPGGIGTFDEFFQAITLKELSQLDKPIILFDVDGYYDKLLDAMEFGYEKGFIRPGAMELFAVCKTAEEVLDTIEAQLKE